MLLGLLLYMSGYTDDVIMQNDLLDPNTSFLEKPFTPEVLSNKIRNLLDTNKSRPHPAVGTITR